MDHTYVSLSRISVACARTLTKRPAARPPFLFPTPRHRQPLNARAPLRPLQPRLSARAPRRTQVTKASARGGSPIIDANSLRCVAMSPRFAKRFRAHLDPASHPAPPPPHTRTPLHPYPAVRFHQSCLAGSPRGPLHARAHMPTVRALHRSQTSLATTLLHNPLCAPPPNANAPSLPSRSFPAVRRAPL
jgi:hypothetical protein